AADGGGQSERSRKLSLIDLDAIDGAGRGVDDGTATPHLRIGATSGESIRVPIAALWTEADVLDEGAEAVLLSKTRPLAGEEGPEIALGLALLRPGLEAKVVGDGNGSEDPDDGHHRHDLDEREALRLSSEGGWGRLQGRGSSALKKITEVVAARMPPRPPLVMPAGPRGLAADVVVQVERLTGRVVATDRSRLPAHATGDGGVDRAHVPDVDGVVVVHVARGGSREAAGRAEGELGQRVRGAGRHARVISRAPPRRDAADDRGIGDCAGVAAQVHLDAVDSVRR